LKEIKYHHFLGSNISKTLYWIFFWAEITQKPLHSFQVNIYKFSSFWFENLIFEIWIKKTLTKKSRKVVRSVFIKLFNSCTLSIYTIFLEIFNIQVKLYFLFLSSVLLLFKRTSKILISKAEKFFLRISKCKLLLQLN